MIDKPQTPSEMGKKSAAVRFKDMTPEQISEYMREVRKKRDKLVLDKRS